MTALSAILLGLAITAAGVHETQNPLYAELQEGAVRAEGQVLAALPAPTMPDTADAQATAAALQTIPLRVPQREFLRDSVVAPYALKVGELTDTAVGIRLRSVDIWFVVHGELQVLQQNRELLEGFLRESNGEIHTLQPEELAARGIVLDGQLASRTHYWHGSSTLLDRVLLSVTTWTLSSDTPSSTVLAGLVDPRFADDAEFRNRWQSVELIPGGQKLGQPQPYHASVFYWKATQLQEPAGAILVEYHSLFEQPADWFGGHDLLRSKLPMVVQDEVRTFRRKLKKAAQSTP